MLAAQHRLHFFFDTYSLIELLTITPIIFLSYTSDFTIIYIEIARIIRILRIIRTVNKFIKFGETEVGQQIFKIILTILTLIMIFSGIMCALEKDEREAIYRQQVANIKSNIFNLFFIYYSLYEMG